MGFHRWEKLMVSNTHLDDWILWATEAKQFLSTFYEVVCWRLSHMCASIHCLSPVIRARRKRKSKQRTFGSKDTLVYRSSKRHIYSLIQIHKWDFGTITILYSQPVAALQILTKDGSWKWVKHVENALVGVVFSIPLSLIRYKLLNPKGRL